MGKSNSEPGVWALTSRYRSIMGVCFLTSSTDTRGASFDSWLGGVTRRAGRSALHAGGQDSRGGAPTQSGSRVSGNRLLTLVRSWIERIDLAKTAATEITETLWGSGSCTFSIVSVINSSLIGLTASRA